MKEKPQIFILKALALSLFLFILWNWKGESYYLSILDNYLKDFLRTLGIRIGGFSYLKDIFNNLIPFISLILVTKDIQFKVRISKLAIGLLILIGVHILLAVGLTFLYRDYPALYHKISSPLYLFNKILPFVLWIILAKRNLLSLFMPKKVLTTK